MNERGKIPLPGHGQYCYHHVSLILQRGNGWLAQERAICAGEISLLASPEKQEGEVHGKPS